MKKKIFICLMAASLLCGSISVPISDIHKEITIASEAVYDTVPEGYTGIYTIDDLYAVRNNLSGKYILMNDIDMSETAPGGDWDNGNGWLPIDGFSGIFDGNGYAIKNMHIYGDIADDIDSIGLFGECEDGSVFIRIALVNCDIDIKTTGSIAFVGAIVGGNYYGGSPYISQCYTNGNINVKIANNQWCCVSGILGYDSRDGNANDIGYSVSKSFNNCDISVEIQNENCKTYVGGISSNAYLNECYNTGLINADSNENNHIGSVISTDIYWKTKCYYLRSSGSYDDASYDNITGLTEAQMKSQSAFIGFDFENVWTIDPTAEYPYPTLINVPYVNTQSSVVEPTQPTTKPSAETKKGDINGDGLVNASDASVILAYYAYLSTGGTIDDIDEWMQNS